MIAFDLEVSVFKISALRLEFHWFEMVWFMWRTVIFINRKAAGLHQSF